ncbi:MAG: PH domain-containing protein [Luteolibacter sp.]
MSTQQDKTWYYATPSNQRIGPVSIAELSALAAQGGVTPETLVWNPDYPEWIPASKISHLLNAEELPKAPPLPEPPAVALTPLPAQELKPRKGSFLFPKLVGTFIIAAVIAAMLAAISHGIDQSPWLALIAFVLIAAFGLVACLAAYRKERYELKATRLISHRGGLFSDEATEFEIRNITHVKVKLPWLRFKFFRVGDVIVETAGTSKPMIMRAIHDPEAIYAGMRERMKSNGYDLSQSQLIHEEKPALIGAIGECIGMFIGIVFFCLFFLGGILSNPEIFGNILVRSGLGVILLIIITFLILHFLDLRRRTYRVFNDVVVYEEGFLTRHNAFIPYENIADSNTKQTLIDQILGLYDVQVSCQGSGSEIKFRRLKNGVHLSDAIDQLVSSASKKQKPAKPSVREDSAQKRPVRVEPVFVPDANFRMTEHRIHALRLLVPQLFLLPLFPIWIIAMFKSLVLLSSTRYFIRPDSLRHSYKFLTVDDREFSYDKITGVVIKRNLWDKWFNTMTLKFWSIGSGKNLEFAHVHCGQVDLPALMRQVGIPPASEEALEVNAHFGVLTWLRAQIWIVFVSVAFAAAIVATAILVEEPLVYALLANPFLVVIFGLIRGKLYYSRQRLRFHDHHIEAEQGILVKSAYFVRYKNAKRLTSTRYPGGEEGALRIYVAGEEEVYAQQTKGKGRKPMLKQCSFTSGMLSRPIETGRLLDDILSGRIDPSPAATPAAPAEVLAESPRSVGNALVTLLLISILLFPLILLLPITIPLTILRVKRWRYRIEVFRIVTNFGVLFRSETSVLLDRVDSLQQSQGMLNKIFRNGKVSIMTAGSSKPDLVLIDAPAYLKLHEEIRERSQ